jgi:hypothetical protein
MFNFSDDAKGEFRRVELLTGPWSPTSLVGGREGTDCRGDPGSGRACVRGGSALAGLFPTSIRLATRDAAGGNDSADKENGDRGMRVRSDRDRGHTACNGSTGVAGAGDQGQACGCCSTRRGWHG